MVLARIEGSSLIAVAGLPWIGDLPRPRLQVLFGTADSIVF